ncbi:hypothetical protein [Neosynechococcus sphagnicola]|uniref:hypothetical protein n=1 Tax=Neosynechococcus sphagnicola TaxID=1501145 RepID=UPI000907D856|nr:hypothetical protein [Neosynechococcus sphagnicola]
MTTHSFTCLSLSPSGLAHPGLAVATVRAGGIGCLDLEFTPPGDRPQVEQNFQQLLTLVKPTDAVGLRLRVDQLSGYLDLLEGLHDRPHWLILAAWTSDSLPTALATLPPTSMARHLLVEVTAVAAVQSLLNQPLKIDGLVARGHESGGWVGEDAAFILTQKLLNTGTWPVYVQGGIGIHAAAACRAAGAAGVVLDDQLWLMPESPPAC